MTTEEFISIMDSGTVVSAGSDIHLTMHRLSQEALRISMELNGSYHTAEEIVALMSELTGREVEPSFAVFPQRCSRP